MLSRAAFPVAFLSLSLCAAFSFAAVKPEPVMKPEDLSAAATILRNADLLLASESGDADKVRALLKAGVSPDATRNTGATALSYAVMGRHLEVVKVLLEARADPNRDTAGMTPLFLASENGDVEIVKALLRAGAKVDAKLQAVDEDMRVRNGDTPLIAAASPTGTAAVTRVLLSAGADVNAKAENGKTAVLQAVAAENVAVLKALLEAKPDVKARMSGEEDFDALTLAVGKGRADLVQMLLAAGADPGVKIDNEVTLLEFAILSNQAEIAAMLREAGVREPAADRLAALRKAAAQP